MAISPISTSRCCSKYDFSREPVADAERCCDADMAGYGPLGGGVMVWGRGVGVADA